MDANCSKVMLNSCARISFSLFSSLLKVRGTIVVVFGSRRAVALRTSFKVFHSEPVLRVDRYDIRYSGMVAAQLQLLVLPQNGLSGSAGDQDDGGACCFVRDRVQEFLRAEDIIIPWIVHHENHRLGLLQEESVRVLVLLLAAEVQECSVGTSQRNFAHEDAVGHGVVGLERPGLDAAHQRGLAGIAVAHHQHLAASNLLAAALLGALK
jgi:hypothetical protein